MGQKHIERFGLYFIQESIRMQQAENVEFSENDVEKMKEALRTLFENGGLLAMADGSMKVCQMYFRQHEPVTPSVAFAMVYNSIYVIPPVDIPLRFESYEVIYPGM